MTSGPPSINASYCKGTNTNLDFHLQGAPNFRVAELNVHGVAQPTVLFNFTHAPLLLYSRARFFFSMCIGDWALNHFGYPQLPSQEYKPCFMYMVSTLRILMKIIC
jgi:hypothetical protein